MTTRGDVFVGEPGPSQAQQAAADRWNAEQLFGRGRQMPQPPALPTSPRERVIDSFTSLSEIERGDSRSPYAPRIRRLMTD